MRKKPSGVDVRGCKLFIMFSMFFYTVIYFHYFLLFIYLFIFTIIYFKCLRCVYRVFKCYIFICVYRFLNVIFFIRVYRLQTIYVLYFLYSYLFSLFFTIYLFIFYFKRLQRAYRVFKCHIFYMCT